MHYWLVTLILAAMPGVAAIAGSRFGWARPVRFVLGTVSGLAILAITGIALYTRDGNTGAPPNTEAGNASVAQDNSVSPGVVPARRTIRDAEPIVARQNNPEHAQIVSAALRTPRSAYELSMELQECSNLDRLVDKHESLSERLDETQMASAKSYLDAQVQKCLPLLGMHESTAYDLIHHAANAGLLEAQVTFPAVAATYINSSQRNMLDDDLIRRFKSDSVRFAVSAANTGEPRGLYHAYTVYLDGLFTEPDYRKAHYYLSEYAKKVNKPGLHDEIERLASLIQSKG